MTLLIYSVIELAASVDSTIPVMKPINAPAMARCHGRNRTPRSACQWRSGIMQRKKTPSVRSIAVGGSARSVRAPSAIPGMPGMAYQATARQSTSRRYASTRAKLPITDATAMIGTACLGPNV